MRKWLLTSIFCVEITGTVLMLDSRKGLKKGSARKKDNPTDGYWEDDTASDIFDKDNEETEETEEETTEPESETVNDDEMTEEEEEEEDEDSIELEDDDEPSKPKRTGTNCSPRLL